MAGGLVTDIAVRIIATVESPQQANVTPAAKPSLIRFGANASREVSQQGLRNGATEMAARLGLKVEDILSRAEEAANLPNSEARINQMGASSLK